ncbi:hypothetical protein DIE18_03315 [Burkholderia sp. Bp9125]|nr:hypothetical protein DIE18_03315 [Burkholderia sp. Bp9125]
MEHTAEFSMRLMDAAAINRRRGLGRLLRSALLLAGFAASAGTCGWGTAHGRSFAGPLDWAMLMLTSGGAGCFGAFVLWLAFVRPLMALLPLVPEDDTWLDASECRALDELCEQEPGLVPYRDRVRAANRGFTCGESDAMFAWAREQEWMRREAEEEVQVDDATPVVCALPPMNT